MNILAIGCHPDDVEIACAGTLAKCVQRGDKVIVCHVSTGNLGHVIIPPDELTVIRANEAKTAGALANIEVICADFNDLQIFDNNEEARQKIVDVIKYANPDASDEEIFEAARRANIHDYITSLEKGYDTEIGERGVKLSGGQKQRLSIARVFLKDPSILILDEATSALDNTTEVLIQGALDELCRGRTTIVVAHRLSTIRNADEIAVVMDGEISERGTHDELIEKGGTYKNLYSLQFRDNDFIE